MPELQLAVRKKMNRPPFALGESKWWHAICLPCWNSRRGKRGGPIHPAHATPTEERCCFCGESKSTFRVRVEPYSVGCIHWRSR